MKTLLILLLLLPITSWGKENPQIKRVIDADTILISAPFIPKPLKQQIPLRLTGVDTPNIKRFANCDREAKLGEEAKRFVVDVIGKSKKQEIKFVGMDKYNRILGQVYLDGKNLSDILLENGLAKPYTGGKKESWCHK